MLEQNASTLTQHKWISKLIGYEFTIEFKSGHANKVVDALSRCGFETEDALLVVISFPTIVWFQKLKQAYLHDQVVQDHFVNLLQNPSSSSLFFVMHGVLLGMTKFIPLIARSLKQKF